ncbi:putative LysR family transcriptional regulator [Oscillibacter valericigenes Sjm18-20]|nr:putative LysR family transcriptional regulator [Oscillibacter valericigenes Sjm18-20]
MLDFRILTFLTVCDTRNYTRAAERLHITQPAVSQHIRCIEEFYGAKLFCSEGKRLVLTSAGEVLRRTAAAMRNDELLLQERLRAGAEKELPLHFGVTMTVGEFLIARPLGVYLAGHSEADVRMEMGNTEELLGKLRRGALNFAIVEGYFDRREFDSALYRTERFIAVSAANHRFARLPTALKDLVGERVLAREPGSGTRDILEKHLTAQNLSLSDFSGVVQIGGMQAILQLLERDVGISFLYEAVARQGIQAGALREILLRDFQVEHDMALIWERGSVFAGEYRDLCRFFMEADEASIKPAE